MIILTARDEEQAEAYRQNSVPGVTVMAYDVDHEETAPGLKKALGLCSMAECNLVIFCGGESKRLPAWGRKGKCFQPYGDRELIYSIIENCQRLTSGLPPGVLVSCGDAVLNLPDGYQVPEITSYAAAFGWVGTSEIAARHGVLIEDGEDVRLVVQCPDKAFLAEHRIDAPVIDTGLWWMSAYACRWYCASDYDWLQNFYKTETETLVRRFRPTCVVPEGATWEHLG